MGDRQLTLPLVLAPLAAPLALALRYVGRVAVADGKEVAAVTLQAAAEAEQLLSKSERAKAILPLCVGVGATAASLALLAPVFVRELAFSASLDSLQEITEIFLLAPLVSTLAAAVAGLARDESRELADRAINLGNRRFSSAKKVGSTWLSATEQIESASARNKNKWATFIKTTVPAPLLGALLPGSLSTKAVFIAALSAAQSAYYLSSAE